MDGDLLAAHNILLLPWTGLAIPFLWLLTPRRPLGNLLITLLISSRPFVELRLLLAEVLLAHLSISFVCVDLVIGSHITSLEFGKDYPNLPKPVKQQKNRPKPVCSINHPLTIRKSFPVRHLPKRRKFFPNKKPRTAYFPTGMHRSIMSGTAFHCWVREGIRWCRSPWSTGRFNKYYSCRITAQAEYWK